MCNDIYPMYLRNQHITKYSAKSTLY
uniref:Uncharacterized protein n=1 Tax=Arundo donax TaxID=35708 RepID=A0A0A9BPD7_ARUDO